MLYIFNLSHKRCKKLCLHVCFVLKWKCVNLHLNTKHVAEPLIITLFNFFFLERNYLVCLTVINKILFGIVVHIKMRSWTFVSVNITRVTWKWHCSMCVPSKSKGEFKQTKINSWHMNNMQTFIGFWYYLGWLALLFGRFSLLVSMSQFSDQFQRITQIHTGRGGQIGRALVSCAEDRGFKPRLSQTKDI